MRQSKIAAVFGVVNAGLAVAYAFGWEVSPEQQAAIVGVVNAFMLAVTAWFDPETPIGPQA